MEEVETTPKKIRKTRDESAPSVKFTSEHAKFILANFINMSNSQMAKTCGLKDQQISGFFSKLKKDTERVVNDPTATAEMKQKAENRLAYISQERNFETSAVGKKKTAAEIDSSYDDIFGGLI